VLTFLRPKLFQDLIFCSGGASRTRHWCRGLQCCHQHSDRGMPTESETLSHVQSSRTELNELNSQFNQSISQSGIFKAA